MIWAVITPQATPESIADRIASLSPAALRTMEILDGVSIKDSMTHAEVVAARAKIAQAYKSYPITWFLWREQEVMMVLREDESEALSLARKLPTLGLEWIASDEKYAKYLKSPEWKKIFDQQAAEKERLWKQLQPEAIGLTPHYLRNRVIAQEYWSKDAWSILTNWNDYLQPKKTGAWCLMSYRDSNGSAPFLVYVPKSYRANKPSPAVLYIYGGWDQSPLSRKWSIREYQIDNPTFAPRNFLDEKGLIGIYPMPNNRFSSQKAAGIKAIRSILAEVKQCLNIDDDRVSAMGFSDGGTACYELARCDATDFATLNPLNGWPGFKLNLRNIGTGRPVYGYFAENDDLYSATNYARYYDVYRGLVPNWKPILVKGAGHLSMFYSDSIMPEIMDRAVSVRRDPFPPRVQLESKSGDVARLDWLEVTGIDPKAPAAPWHAEVPLKGKPSADGEVRTYITNEGCGMIEAERSGNEFWVKTSRITSFRLYLSPKMVDLGQKIRVIVDGVERYNDLVKPDNKEIIQQFMNTGDRRNLPKAILDIVLGP